jgi:hypothetical protein
MSPWEDIGKSDEWFTPKYIFEAMGVTFDLDVAGQEGTHVPCRSWIDAGALRQPWHGFIWMNPPFGGRNAIEPWLEKFIAHGDGVALTPDRTSAPWFQRAAAQMNAVLFVSPKIKFERADGSLGRSPGCGTALMAKGQRGVNALVNARNAGLGLLMKEIVS